MNKNKWVCPKGHTFTLRSGYFACRGEYQTYLDPKIGAEDSPCEDFIIGCTEYMRDACLLAVVAYFEGEGDE